MISEVSRMVDSHLKWLKDATLVKAIEGTDWVEITTPFLDRHNDMLQYYVRKEGDRYLLSDGGEIIEDLEQSGCRLESSKRQSLLKMTLNGFGIELNDTRLEVKASTTDFPLRQHSLIQAMIAVNDLFYLAQPNVQGIFFEDVKQWLEGADIRFTENVSLIGKSGLPHHFEIIIPKSKSSPERIIEAVNNPTRNIAEHLAFKWMDTRESRPQGTKAIAILNDQETSIPPNILDALRNCDIAPVAWGTRSVILNELAA